MVGWFNLIRVLVNGRIDMSDWRLNYWKEALECALEDIPNELTDEQLTSIAGDLAIASEMEDQASGVTNIPNPLRAEIDNLKRKHEKELQESEAEILAYRTSVAERRGVSLTDVHIKYGKLEVIIYPH